MEYSAEAWEANLVCANVLQKYGRYDDAEDAILRNLDVSLERSQSRVALLGLYYSSDNKAKLAEQLQDPDWVKDIPARQLVMIAAKIGQKELPLPVVDQLSTSLQATPRLNVGRDDFVVAISPTWQIQNATVTLHVGERTYGNPRISNSRDSVLLSFNGVAEFGNPLSAARELSDVSMSIKYPDGAPIKLVLKSKIDDSKAFDLSNIKLVGRTHPVYGVVALEQNDQRVSLLHSNSSMESFDLNPSSSRTTTKPVLNVEEDPSNDDTALSLPQ